MKMKTLAVDGDQFRVNDDGAVRYDEAQTLDDKQKKQARENISAARKIDGGIVIEGKSGYASIEVLDKADETGYKHTALYFLGHEDDTVKLSHLTDGEQNWDAATVGQLKSTINDNTLVVTLSDDGTTASHTAAQIYEHIQNCGKAVMHISTYEQYIPLSFCGYGDFPVAVFSYLWDDYTAATYMVNDNGAVAYSDMTFAASADLRKIKTDIGNIETTLATQQEQIDTNTDAVATLTEHATYKNLYGKVEITADDVAAAGEEGITLITIGSDDVDLANYNKFAIKIFVPADEILNNGNKNLTIYSTSDSRYSTAEANILLKVQGTAVSAGIIKPAYRNFFTIRANFAGDTFLYGELIKHNDAGSYGYPGSSNGWVNVSSGFQKSTKKYFHIGSNGGTFKFPAGSYVEVYGR